MSEFLCWIVGLACGCALTWAWRRFRSGPSRLPRHYRIAQELRPFFSIMAHPRELSTHAEFERGVQLVTESHDVDGLLTLSKSDHQVIVCMALEALRRYPSLEPPVIHGVLEGMETNSNWARFYGLAVLAQHSQAPIVAHLLRRLDTSWGTPEARQMLVEFVALRQKQGEEPCFEGLSSEDEDDVEFTEAFLKDLDARLGVSLSDAFRHSQRASPSLDTAFLSSFGRFLDAQDCDTSEVIELDSLSAHVEAIEDSLSATSARSVLLVGEEGVGKSTTVSVLARRLIAAGWTVFEASGSSIISGQSHMGELEERVQKFLAAARGHAKFLWIAQSLHELAQLGRHRYSNISILDLIVPALENGELRLLSAVHPAALERLVGRYPRLPLLVDTVRLESLSKSKTIEIARRWAERASPDGGPPRFPPVVLEEAYELSRQFLGSWSNPGALLSFLRLVRENEPADRATKKTPVAIDDLYLVLAGVTGLPLALLDDRAALDVEAIQKFFESRVMGQPEAVSCLVERIAMIKAGLTDPTRPQGVFLFTGPTGTGKTEIAKTLAEFLFGSPDRMIRLDMSEFQTSESLSRILGESEPSTDALALVNQIRKQPFSVVLLDEFEKAHSRIWDLFLQVFDDGRLTDGQGNVADCRHTIIILTANVGEHEFQGDAIGFRASPADVAPAVERALSQLFRQEFLNRIDRVVPFFPLNKSVMREVLHRELDVVLERRGLRNRQWAVEWDASAIDFLLARGFSATYGARPLKRAVERYLLSPLAMTIVGHRIPEGDQFLFVRSDGESIDVEFVDPDAPEPVSAPAAAGAAELRVEKLALDATGEPQEVHFLECMHAEFVAAVDEDAWKTKKNEALAAMSSSDFWSSEERFTLLAQAEYRDRIEAGVGAAGSLLSRLRGREPEGRKRYAAHIVKRLAEQLFLVGAALEGIRAGDPQDAFLLVEGTRDSLADPVETDRFADRVGLMYRRWASRRRMTFEELEARPGDGGKEPFRLVAAISGYAAFRLLKPERGFHVLEAQSNSQNPKRYRVRVAVAPQPDAPLSDKARVRLSRALQCLADAQVVTPPIVRRYREEPSPLVRDSTRGWRTGHLAQVLDGNFDLIT